MVLLERNSELEILQRRLEGANAGEGSLLLVAGEAGIGKTALVREFGSQLPVGYRFLTGACDPLSTPAAHAPLHDLAAELSLEVVELLRNRGEPPLLFSAVLSALRAMPGTVILFEDIHWADEGTLDLLRFLSRRIVSAPVLFIVTARNDECGASGTLRQFLGELARTAGCTRIVLAPLSQDAVSTMVGDRLLSANALHRRTGGNPFFVTELLDAASDLPVSISDAVLGRLIRLRPEVQRAVHVAAVIGPSRTTELIVAVAGEDILSSLDEAIEAGIMQVSNHGIGFRHELAREAILESTTPLRRREIYRAILRIAAEQLQDADLAWMAHYAIGAADEDAILLYSTRAAERAAALGAIREAADHYQHALGAAAGRPDEIRVPILEGYAAATTTSGWTDENLRARAELIEIYRARGDRRSEVDHLRATASTYILAGNNAAGEIAIQQAIELLSELEEDALHARVYATRSIVLMLDRRNEEAIDWGERAIQLAKRYDDQRTILQAQNAIGSALIVSGNLEDGRRVMNEAIANARVSGNDMYAVNLRSNLGTSSGEIFEFDTAEPALLTTIEEARAADLDGPLSYATSWLGLVRLYQGRWDESTHLAERALATPHRYAISQIMALVTLGRVRARRGDPGVWEALDEALQVAEPTGTLQRIAPVAAARAEARWLEGDREGTIAEAMRGYGLAVGHGHRWHAGELGYWLHQAGADAASPVEPVEPWKLHLSGEFSEASVTWERRGCPYEAARVRFDCGQIDSLRSALGAFETLGAAPMVSRTTQRLRQLGAQAIPRGPRPATRANPAGLTCREIEVLELLAAGSTYAEIGKTLYVSTRTVEHHVSSILRKLGTRTRREAVRLSIERSIIPG